VRVGLFRDDDECVWIVCVMMSVCVWIVCDDDDESVWIVMRVYVCGLCV